GGGPGEPHPPPAEFEGVASSHLRTRKWCAAATHQRAKECNWRANTRARLITFLLLDFRAGRTILSFVSARWCVDRTRGDTMTNDQLNQLLNQTFEITIGKRAGETRTFQVKLHEFPAN